MALASPAPTAPIDNVVRDKTSVHSLRSFTVRFAHQVKMEGPGAEPPQVTGGGTLSRVLSFVYPNDNPRNFLKFSNSMSKQDSQTRKPALDMQNN